MTIDIDAVRADTPGCKHVVHLNNAGASLRPLQVTEAVIDHLRLEDQLGGYEAAAAAAPQLVRTTEAIAELLRCDTSEVALAENASRAWDLAFHSIPFQPGERILCSRAEYVTNALGMLQVARTKGVQLEVIEDDEHGQLDLDDLERRLDDRAGPVALVAVTHVPTQSGLINPAAEVGARTRAAGVPFLLDACQSAGQLDLDVERLGCDMLSATGRKYLRGPRGTGFLYVSAERCEQLEPPFIELGSASWTSATTYALAPGARRFETWESDIAARIGLGVAVDYARGLGLAAIEERIHALSTALRTALAQLDGVEVADRGVRLSGIVTFTVAGRSASEVQSHLHDDGINVSVTYATSAQLDLPRRGLDEVVRASIHYYNTDAEIEQLCGSLERLLGSQRGGD